MTLRCSCGSHGSLTGCYVSLLFVSSSSHSMAHSNPVGFCETQGKSLLELNTTTACSAASLPIRQMRLTGTPRLELTSLIQPSRPVDTACRYKGIEYAKAVSPRGPSLGVFPCVPMRAASHGLWPSVMQAIHIRITLLGLGHATTTKADPGSTWTTLMGFTCVLSNEASRRTEVRRHARAKGWRRGWGGGGLLLCCLGCRLVGRDLLVLL